MARGLSTIVNLGLEESWNATDLAQFGLISQDFGPGVRVASRIRPRWWNICFCTVLAGLTGDSG